jgi:SAM-dependent methyltransferase
MTTYDQAYWDARYRNQETQWDIGYPAPPLTHYFDQLTDKTLRILIPGCGNAYEAEYLIQQAFEEVNVIDISKEAIENMRHRKLGLRNDQLHFGDFFAHQAKYDLIVEQTFFCALDPSQRQAYVQKMAELLPKGGKLMGVLFDDKLNSDHPPFGGDKDAYQQYFATHFHIRYMETAYNSIGQRAGRELFVLFEKK